MILFISLLRAIATCLITNSHYTGIYPTDLIANGGLLGDIIFFAVSGFCLYRVKGNFAKWYTKRIWRIYLPLILVTLLFMVLGFYTTEQNSVFWWLVYPTYYHFIASIVVLYIPFYFICKFEILRNSIPKIMLAIFTLSVVWYIFAYDRSYYHIDNVREPFIRALFMESMLLGAYFRHHDSFYRNNKNHRFLWVLFSIITFALYFVSKMFFQKYSALSNFQFLNCVIIFALLYFIMRLFSSVDNKLKNMPQWIKGIALFLADITLEIYLVQYVIIDLLRNKLFFPVNWFVLTATIIAAAYILHIVSKKIFKWVDCIVAVISKKSAIK